MQGGIRLKILSVIPARGGSKGIPRKNIKMLCGKPLIAYVIHTLKSSKYDLDIVVSSDDNEILTVASKYGAVPLLRSKDLSSDAVTLDPVVYDSVLVVEKQWNKKYDYIITIQPTSPLLGINTLDSAIEAAIVNEYDTVISAINAPKLSWKNQNGKFVPNYTKRVNRQYMEEYYVETGAFVISKRSVITESSRFGEKVSRWISENRVGTYLSCFTVN